MSTVEGAAGWPPVHSASLVAKPVQQRLSKIGLKRPLVPRLEHGDVPERLNEDVLNDVARLQRSPGGLRVVGRGPTGRRSGK